MEVLITLGRDSVVAYQNEASARIDVLPVGASIISRTFLMSAEEVRDLIFSGKTISYSNRPFFHKDQEILLTRDYRPLCGRDGEIVGVISTGWSRKAPSAREYSELSAIVSALESPELPNELSAAGLLGGPSDGGLAGSVMLARRLRRFLPQQIH
jgi:hypothetical protein